MKIFNDNSGKILELFVIMKFNPSSCSKGASTSPEDTKNMARESLRTVLRKSGSDSPTGDAPDFSFYDNLNSDPLLNIEFSENVATDSENSHAEVGSGERIVNSSAKKAIVRSQSDTGMSKTLTVIKNIYKDNEDFEPGKSGTVNRLEDIFSDSECPKKGEEENVKVKAKSKGHKRSRSDHGGIKVEKGPQKEKGKVPNKTQREDSSEPASKGLH